MKSSNKSPSVGSSVSDSVIVISQCCGCVIEDSCGRVVESVQLACLFISLIKNVN